MGSRKIRTRLARRRQRLAEVIITPPQLDSLHPQPDTTSGQGGATSLTETPTVSTEDTIPRVDLADPTASRLTEVRWVLPAQAPSYRVQTSNTNAHQGWEWLIRQGQALVEQISSTLGCSSDHLRSSGMTPLNNDVVCCSCECSTSPWFRWCDTNGISAILASDCPSCIVLLSTTLANRIPEWDYLLRQSMYTGRG